MRNNEFGQFLKSAREKAGVSQKEISTALGYNTPQFVSNWERGVAMPPISALKKIAKLINVPADQLFVAIEDSMVSRLRNQLKREYKQARS